MDSENKYWLIVIGIISIAVVLVSFIIANYYITQGKTVANMIKNGASPIEAMCAIQDDYGNNPTCIISATKRINYK